MKALLLRVGIDKGTDKALAPIFENGQFEYIPMSEKCASTEKFIYGNKPSKNSDCPLSTYLPKALENKIMHLDPEFDTPSYGDITSKRNYLLELEEDDLLVFYTGLTPFKNTIFKEALYLIGYFTVKEKIDFNKLSEVQMEEAYQRYKNNAHIKRLGYPQNFDNSW